MEEKLKNLKALLDDQYDWPCHYTFKFVGSPEHEQELILRVGSMVSKKQPSKSGKYISYTFVVEITCSDEVIKIYKNVSEVSGIISL